MPQDNKTRAKEIRTRLYHAGISITLAAQKINRTRVHVSRVLTGDVDSVPVLDALEQLLSDMEEKPQHAAAMAA